MLSFINLSMIMKRVNTVSRVRIIFTPFEETKFLAYYFYFIYNEVNIITK